MNSIPNKPRAVHYESPSDRIMTIGQRVARYNRYLIAQGKRWDGDGYEVWALRSMARFLEQTVARNLCLAPDTRKAIPA
jgi:hypothetical protein